MSTSPEFRAIVERLAKAKGASTPRQLSTLVAEAAKRLPVYVTDTSFSDMAEQTIGWTLDKAIEGDKRLAMPVPSVSQVVDAIAADAAAKGSPMDAGAKMTLSRSLASGDADTLLDKLPAGATLPKAPAATQSSSAQSGTDWTQDKLDAEIESRFGVKVSALTSEKRRAYSQAIRNEHAKTATPLNDQLRAGRDPKTLSAAERVEAFREEQRAKAAR
jgi:hypothetical protein